MTPTGRSTVRIRVVWLADGDAVRRGRVVVQRSGPETGAPSAFWLSDRLPAGVVLGVHRATAPLAWHDLLAGRPVDEVPGPVLLRPAERSALDALARDLAGSDTAPAVQRPLLLATAALDDGVAVAARVVRFAGDVLSHAFDAVFEAAPQGLVLTGKTVGGFAAVVPDPGTGPAEDAWIRVADVAATRPGVCRAWVNRLVVGPAGLPARTTPTDPDAAPGPLLADPRVLRLTTVLAAHPADEGAREALAGALAAAGRPVEAVTTCIDVGGGSRAVLDLLDGLVALAERGPDGHAAPSRVTLVAPTTAASALLRGDDRLAAALVDYLVPAGDEAATPSLRRRRELRAALQAAAAGAAGDGRLPR